MKINKLTLIGGTETFGLVDKEDHYVSLRKRYEDLGDNLFKLTLSVVNRPSDKGTLFQTNREFLNDHLLKFLGRPIGEMDSSLVRRRLRENTSDNIVKIFSQIEIPHCAGELISYSVSGIRDGSGSLAIEAQVKLNDKASDMIRSGCYCFGIRAFLTPSPNTNCAEIVEVCAFDLMPVGDLINTL